MKRMTIEELPKNIRELIAATPREQVLLTKRGKPFAIIRDASNYDEEDIGYMSDPEFWKMIAERRREKGGIPLEQVMARIEREEARLRNGKKTRNALPKRKGKKNGSSRSK
jgi:PHD/YefM family antitoxin component YafN of YafNO toxin-antitoxin module